MTNPTPEEKSQFDTAASRIGKSTETLADALDCLIEHLAPVIRTGNPIEEADPGKADHPSGFDALVDLTVGRLSLITNRIESITSRLAI